MIGIKYVNGTNRIMEDRLEVTDEGVGSDIIGRPSQGPVVSSTRKPSILRKQMLRRATNRTRKRPPGTALADGDHSVATAETIEGDSDCAAVMVEPSTIPQISSGNKEDQPWDEVKALRLMAEFELMNGARIDRNETSKDGVDANCGLDISIIESEDEASGVEASLIEEHESKAEVDVEVKSVEQIKEEKPSQTKIVNTSVVANSNLSIVLAGNDIVVEYRDDNSKGSLPPKTPASSLRQSSVRNRPKGIMKRPRHSKIKYHHPQRPLPPPRPPPGYREVNSSPKSCATATSIDSGYSSSGNQPLMRKRVSFNEQELVEQFNMSRLRRKAKYDKRRSFLGILSMAMPVVMPYLMAVLILVASSMVPLPTDQNYQQQRQESFSLQPEFESHLPKPAQPPIFMDVGSRMWEERRKAREAAAASEIKVT